MQTLERYASGPLTSFKRPAIISHRSQNPMDFARTISENEDAWRITWRFRLTDNKSISYTTVVERMEDGVLRKSVSAGQYTPDNFLKEFPFMKIENPDETHQFVYMALTPR